MGITNLSKAIRDVAPAAIRETTLADYAGKTFAIDACIWMYRFKYVGDVVSLFEQQVLELRAANIRPIYFFDGKACAAKQAEVERRREQKRRDVEAVGAARAQREATQSRSLSTMTNPLAEIIAAEEAVKAAEKRVESQPRSDDYSAVRRKLGEMGVQVEQAPSDGEAACARAVQAGVAHVAVTEDFDVLAYGATRMLTRLGKETMVEYSLERILADTGFSYETFVDFCILCGSDLCGKIKGIGQKRAFGLLREHGSIEAILSVLPPRYEVPDDFDYPRARAEFMHVG